jgi:hypothetical protein
MSHSSSVAMLTDYDTHVVCGRVRRFVVCVDTVSDGMLCCLWRRCNHAASSPRTSPPSGDAKTASRHAFRGPTGATQCLALLQMIEIVYMINVVRVMPLPDTLVRYTATSGQTRSSVTTRMF